MPSKHPRTRERRAPLTRSLSPACALALMLTSFSSAAHAEGYFGGRDLDFWKEGKRVSPAVPMPSASKDVATQDAVLPPPSGSIIRQRDALPFDWKRYENPSSPEFWDDGGDYVAPRPLREAVANPTKENLERYVAWQAKRLEVIAAFGEKLAAHAMVSATGGAPAAPLAPEKKDTRPTTLTPSSVRWNEVEILYFYQTSCPHCRAEKDHIEDLARRGARVSFIQLDADERPPLHAGSVSYTRAHSAQFAVTATPTWILRRREKFVRLEGEQDDTALTARALALFASGPS